MNDFQNLSEMVVTICMQRLVKHSNKHQTNKHQRPKGKERAAHQQAELQFRFPNEHLCVM